MESRAQVYVRGLVQGLGFRYETWKHANRFGVTGWIRNLSDGCVEAVFEGEREKIERIIEFCRKGPPGAEIQSIEVKWELFRGEFDRFLVKN